MIFYVGGHDPMWTLVENPDSIASIESFYNSGKLVEVDAMSGPRKTSIVTGASQGIGAGILKAFDERGFDVVANAREMTRSAEIAASDAIALVDGDIGEAATGARIVETALARFGSIDALVNNAGIFFIKLRPRICSGTSSAMKPFRRASSRGYRALQSVRRSTWKSSSK